MTGDFITSQLWPSVPFMTSLSTPAMKTNDIIPTAPGMNLTKVYIGKYVGTVKYNLTCTFHSKSYVN